MEGVYNTCLCKNETYTLTVTHLDDTVEKLKLNINVVGTCVDTIAPPAPNQNAPGNGASLTCRSYVDLAWGAVSDASGTSQYQVKAQRHAGDNNWTNVAGAVLSPAFPATPTICMWSAAGPTAGRCWRWMEKAISVPGLVGGHSSTSESKRVSSPETLKKIPQGGSDG